MAVIGFPKWGKSMVITTATAEMVQKTGIDLGGLMRAFAPEVGATDAWGSRAGGRIIAPLPVEDLIERCVQMTIRSLES